MSWIQTYSGQRFDPINPDPAAIRSVDIARALSMVCRYTGHVRRFYSVAEHSCHLYDQVRERSLATRRYALLHDASEAYIADVSRPVKPHLPGYQEIEARLMAAILARYDVDPSPAEKAFVTDLDIRICHDEAAALLPGGPLPGWNLPGGPLGVTIQGWLPANAGMEFRSRARECGLW